LPFCEPFCLLQPLYRVENKTDFKPMFYSLKDGGM
jgi:hypothetical protein